MHIIAETVADVPDGSGFSSQLLSSICQMSTHCRGFGAGCASRKDAEQIEPFHPYTMNKQTKLTPNQPQHTYNTHLRNAAPAQYDERLHKH
jgi:hypothetical protein